MWGCRRGWARRDGRSAAGTDMQMCGWVREACRCSWNSQAGYEAVNRMRWGGACQELDIRRGSFSALPTAAVIAVLALGELQDEPLARAPSTGLLPLPSPATSLHLHSLICVWLLLLVFMLIFQENKLCSCKPSQPVEQVSLLQSTSSLSYGSEIMEGAALWWGGGLHGPVHLCMLSDGFCLGCLCH